jgi:uncharacterized membrane protein YidH (DUF202 family)
MSGEGRVSDYLANERTFLAWIRTSIAVMSLGFVVAKFSLWLRLLGTRIQPQPPLRSTGTSLTLGVSAIARGDAGSDDRLVVGVSMLVAVLGVAMIGYMLSTR